jgi:hypothetical protein
MSQTTRTLVGFLVAPAVPGVLLYFYNFFWMGYGDAAVVGPLILAFYGYAASLILGIPIHLALHRKGVHSLSAYLLLGALIGPVFFLTFELLTTYPGTRILWLQHAHGLVLVAAAYSSIAAITFWSIVCR